MTHQLSDLLLMARSLDEEDPLSGIRERFYTPRSGIYIDGNSLGLLSVDAEQSLLRVMGEWKNKAIGGWIGGDHPWYYYGENYGDMAAPLVGALPGEVVMTGTTTSNIHSLISSFYHPTGKRTKILADELTFPSDIYALQGQLQIRGFDPEEHLVLVKSRDGYTLNEQDIIDSMNDETALIFLPGVLYRSGQLLDIELLTNEAHSRNIPIGFDVAHSVGAVPHRFSQWGVDFAVWCSYKYLNGGPGCAAFLYVNSKNFPERPFLKGWFGCDKNRQFEMLNDFISSATAGKWQMSSAGILGSSAIEGSLNIILEAGIDNIRRKSLKMTAFLIDIIQNHLNEEPYCYSVVTPFEENRRGGHVAVKHPHEAYRITEALKARGIIPDFRPPDIIRIAPVALYNTFEEVWKVAYALKEIIDNKEFEQFTHTKPAVS
jgi:kynureninase